MIFVLPGLGVLALLVLMLELNDRKVLSKWPYRARKDA